MPTKSKSKQPRTAEEAERWLHDRGVIIYLDDETDETSSLKAKHITDDGIAPEEMAMLKKWRDKLKPLCKMDNDATFEIVKKTINFVSGKVGPHEGEVLTAQYWDEVYQSCRAGRTSEVRRLCREMCKQAATRAKEIAA